MNSNHSDIAAPRGTRTRTVHYTTPRCHGRVTPEQFIGHQAIYRAWTQVDGRDTRVRLIGTITGEDRTAGVPYLTITFADGQHARLDSHIDLVIEQD